MSYLDIFIMGWNLNAVMFAINFFLAIKVISTEDKEQLQKQSFVLKNLKEELDKYYPNKTLTTLLSYAVPFTAFFRLSFRFIEMFFFFQKNKEAKMYDYMIYRYSYEIEKAKSR